MQYMWTPHACLTGFPQFSQSVVLSFSFPVTDSILPNSKHFGAGMTVEIVANDLLPKASPHVPGHARCVVYIFSIASVTENGVFVHKRWP